MPEYTINSNQNLGFNPDIDLPKLRKPNLVYANGSNGGTGLSNVGTNTPTGFGPGDYSWNSSYGQAQTDALNAQKKYYESIINKEPDAFDRIGQVGQGIQALSGLANAYMGYKQYGLAEDAFDFQKGLANRNLENQSKAYNTDYLKRKKVGLALSGMSEADKEEALNKAKENLLDTSEIG